MSIDAEKMVKVFVKMRDKRAELKRAWEAEDADIRAKQEKIEAVLLDHLNFTSHGKLVAYLPRISNTDSQSTDINISCLSESLRIRFGE